ncbi:MAG: transcriptional regulator [Bacteroidetes bacterium]|nr:MAG: transcriptional regulator [Bacteroidota bacterium]
MDFGNKMMQARKDKNLSREQLGKKVGTSGPIVGRYERGDMMPSIEIAAKVADALEISLDYLVGKSSLEVKDKKMLDRLESIAKIPEANRTELFNVIDAYLRDFKAKQAYAS